MTSPSLKFSKVDICPACARKLCKRKTEKGINYIEFKHKGAEVLTGSAFIKCINCNVYYDIDANLGIIGEVPIGKQ